MNSITEKQESQAYLVTGIKRREESYISTRKLLRSRNFQFLLHEVENPQRASLREAETCSFAERSEAKLFFESLILAQDERWRRA